MPRLDDRCHVASVKHHWVQWVFNEEYFLCAYVHWSVYIDNHVGVMVAVKSDIPCWPYIWIISLDWPPWAKMCWGETSQTGVKALIDYTTCTEFEVCILSYCSVCIAMDVIWRHVYSVMPMSLVGHTVGQPGLRWLPGAWVVIDDLSIRHRTASLS